MSNESAVQIQTEAQLEQLKSEEELMILYFSSKNCNVCRAVFPKLMNLVEGYPVKVFTTSIDEQREIAGQALVFTAPTILLIHEGREILRESRFIDFRNIERVLNYLA